MITGEMKNKVDSIWDTIWTGGITSPITVLEQITYLMFMKLLDDNQLKAEANANLLGVPLKDKVFQDGTCVISETPRVETEYKNLRWNVFHNFEPGEMLTNIQTYVFPFIKTIGEGKDTAFSRYMKDTVFLIPTAKVLAKVVDGIDAMDMNNKDIMGDVYEYLLGKIAAAGENGQFRTPRHIINMMVELMQPTLKDSILDPAMGSAGFLLSSAAYISEHQKKELMKTKNIRYFKSCLFSGFDTDQSMLRIGAMSMMLHGVEDPHITYQDSLSGENTERDQYSLIMANPPFTGSVLQEEISTDLLGLCKTRKTELLFVALFTKMLKVGGRCACIVPDGVLFGSSKAHQAIRHELVAYVRAVEFEDAVDVMERSSVHLLIPEIVNAAFSCELILKATIIMEKGKQVDFKSHRFDVLFSMLTPGTQKKVRAGSLIFDWDRFMRVSSNAFVEWRYLHETDGVMAISISDMQRFFNALKKHYEESYPQVKSVTVITQKNSDLWGCRDGKI